MLGGNCGPHAPPRGRGRATHGCQLRAAFDDAIAEKLRSAIPVLQAGNHCWCGAPVAGAPAVRARDQAECQVDRCHGNSSEVRGGNLGVLVYVFACEPASAAKAAA